jgi:hypothetical protein
MSSFLANYIEEVFKDDITTAFSILRAYSGKFRKYTLRQVESFLKLKVASVKDQTDNFRQNKKMHQTEFVD